MRDEHGNITEILCTYDPESKTGGATASLTVKGTLHGADAQTAKKACVRLYDYLLTDEGEINPDSLKEMRCAVVEPQAANEQPGERLQFMRQGYFVLDEKQEDGTLVFNQIVGLKDSFAKTLK